MLYWKDEKLLIRLPSGRDLCYLSPRTVPNRFGNDGIGYLASMANGQLGVQETFGGKACENVTQAIARDLLAHAMLNLEANGYRIVFHVHDECVMEMPMDTGSVEEACAIMGETPTGAMTCPSARMVMSASPIARDERIIHELSLHPLLFWPGRAIVPLPKVARRRPCETDSF